MFALKYRIDRLNIRFSCQKDLLAEVVLSIQTIFEIVPVRGGALCKVSCIRNMERWTIYIEIDRKKGNTGIETTKSELAFRALPVTSMTNFSFSR